MVVPYMVAGFHQLAVPCSAWHRRVQFMLPCYPDAEVQVHCKCVYVLLLPVILRWNLDLITSLLYTLQWLPPHLG